MKIQVLLSVILSFFLSCRQESAAPESITKVTQVEAESLTDRFYVALTGRDSSGVDHLLSRDARLYGTDPSEDWSLAEIRNYLSEKKRDTTRKAVFKVLTREVRTGIETACVIDKVDVSTTKVPFRIISIYKREGDSLRLDVAVFSALVRNEDMKGLEMLMQADGNK